MYKMLKFSLKVLKWTTLVLSAPVIGLLVVCYTDANWRADYHRGQAHRNYERNLELDREVNLLRAQIEDEKEKTSAASAAHQRVLHDLGDVWAQRCEMVKLSGDLEQLATRVRVFEKETDKMISPRTLAENSPAPRKPLYGPSGERLE